MSAKSDTFSVRLTEDLRQRVDELARLSRRSRSFIVQEAVAAYIRDHSAYLRDLNEAVASAETGAGHSEDQIFSWMRSWGTAGEQPSPEPDLPVRK
jgi:predicted transcriptional regulator